jgi:hypothetical protein
MVRAVRVKSANPVLALPVPVRPTFGAVYDADEAVVRR